jgi:ComF family protein
MASVSLFKRIFFPHTCILCAEHTTQARDICMACEQELPWLTHACVQCGIILPTTTSIVICGHCQQHPQSFNRTFALFNYADPIDRIITAAKFNQQLIYTKLLGQLLAERVRHHWYQHQPLPELIIPVPLHATRLRERGYNQAVEIAKTTSKLLRLPMSIQHCIRSKPTIAQTSLHLHERAANMKHAFALKQPITAKHIAIIDDVVTTGQTVSELSQLCRQAGVMQIDIWCCARTQPQ